MKHGTAEFKKTDETVPSPLAKQLLKIEGITEVFLGKDFITVSKADTAEWSALESVILGAIMEHFSTEQEVMYDVKATTASEEKNNDDEIVQKIKELLDTRIRPVIAQDGGDVVFDSFEDGIVYLRLRGSCSGCPAAAATLKTGVENVLQHFIPEVKEVRSVE